MGNPHAVQVVDDVETYPVLLEGPLIEHHPRFPNRVNAGFMQVIDNQHIRLRVFERGTGETLACGTGACAAVVAGIRRGLLISPVRVSMHGGELSIAWQGAQSEQSENNSVFLSGPAVSVFDGEINI
jgi:diaminopimelate epimerase